MSSSTFNGPIETAVFRHYIKDDSCPLSTERSGLHLLIGDIDTTLPHTDRSMWNVHTGVDYYDSSRRFFDCCTDFTAVLNLIISLCSQRLFQIYLSSWTESVQSCSKWCKWNNFLYGGTILQQPSPSCDNV